MRRVADDGDCLFAAIAHVCYGEPARAGELRRLAVSALSAEPQRWSSAVLGKERPAYLAAMAEKGTWGSAIEASVLAEQLRLQLDILSVQTPG